MFFKLFILFALIPVIELAILIKVGYHIGVGYTLLIVIGTALVGAYLVRLEGFNIMGRFQRNVNEGVFPTEEIFDGALVLVSGALLLTPGLVTDLTGFLLVFPPSRKVIKGYLKKFIKARTRTINIEPGDFRRG
ncbi:MAG: FxsA family protein [Thermodesulfobacteriota bacterium]